jgi:hypothetical protein
MVTPIKIGARWDSEARVWIATSDDVPGLVVEAETWQTLIDEIRLVLPDLLDVSRRSGNPTELPRD